MIIWVFIGIGCAAALFLTIAAIMNLSICIKEKSFKSVVIRTQIFFLAANITFFIYALGISLCNLDSPIFWNSMPTWIGNALPLILNTIMIVGKIVYERKTKIHK